MKVQPVWQPIGMLPLVAQTLDEHLAQARERLESIDLVREMRSAPPLDAVAHLKAVIGEHYRYIPVFREQFVLWRKEACLDEEVMSELQRLDAVLDQLMVVLGQILERVD